MGARPDLYTLGFLVSDSARLMRVAFERRISQAGLGITPGEARALLTIAAAGGSRQLDIAARMGVEPMTLCTYLDKFQALGLIERQQCSADRRAKRITLTESSGDLIERVRNELRAVMVEATEGMSEEDRFLLDDTLKIFNANLQMANSSPSPAAADESR
ncbi:MarR family winged helix-turn-helix transcriptional regulator [Rhizobium sp. LC145]|jgi:MarR family transcriptional regulator, transcriptional regulator for hemolysin|uniref:MarR family winged helix-turn-helix transcriptional regulator n=1 Tax=Rhizobium sp. LC145 TaxID=1120688 RepID=UPI00062A3C66|nr:MarR family winged helix-turn-helix transcriptional regulator [Rhizobium sp. LC145]KKX27756.1 transcriptional regulator [Rhizobium sp. LC145]TKT45555.1 winged helix-turn-helix transcriptional regulator [Rhizobiaceae bacterium LC148]